MSPYEISLLFNVFTHAKEFDLKVTASNSLFTKTTNDMMNTDLIQSSPSSPLGYVLTDRGHAYIERLTSLPLPKAGWLDENNNPIILED